MKSWQLRVKKHFDAAHKLRDYDGPCANLHGHRWDVEVELEVHELRSDGLAVDFKVIKGIMNSILPDHTYLNDWMPENPTAENVAQKLYHLLCKCRVDEAFDVKVRSITVWESPECSVTYKEGREDA